MENYDDLVGEKGIDGVLTIEDLLKIYPNRYVVAEVVSQRAHHLNAGVDKPKIDLGVNPISNEPRTCQEIGYVQVAIAELLSGAIKPKLASDMGGPAKNIFPNDYERIPDSDI